MFIFNIAADEALFTESGVLFHYRLSNPKSKSREMKFGPELLRYISMCLRRVSKMTVTSAVGANTRCGDATR